MRFLALIKSAESTTPPPPELMAALGTFGQEAAEAGVLVESGGLAPTAVSARVRVADGDVDVLDGPFAETKEVIGGYAIYEVASREEALDWTRQFMELHRRHWPEWQGESEVRQMFGPGDMPPQG